MVEPYGTEEVSTSPRFSPMIFGPRVKSVLVRAHLRTAVLLLAHLCTAVIIGSIRRTLCSKLFIMRAWRPIYTYVQQECSAETSIGRTLCDWGICHLSSVLANESWSTCTFSVLTSTLYTAELLRVHRCTVLLIGSMRRPLCSKLFMMGALRPIYRHIQRECLAEPYIGRTLCDWGVFHLFSVLTNDFLSPCKFSALTKAPFDTHASSVFLGAHVCTAKLLLAHLCTAVLIGSTRRTLCSKLFMMRAWRPIYTYVQQDCPAEPSMVEPYGTEEVSTSPRFSPMIFDPHVKSVLVRAHLRTAVFLLVHLCTAVIIGSMRRTLCWKLFMMRAWRPIYTYAQQECSAEPSIGRTLCGWGVIHLSSVLANDFWSPCKFSALTSTPLYSRTPTSTSWYRGINRLYAQNPVFEIVHGGSAKACLKIWTTGMSSRTLYW